VEEWTKEGRDLIDEDDEEGKKAFFVSSPFHIADGRVPERGKN